MTATITPFPRARIVRAAPPAQRSPFAAMILAEDVSDTDTALRDERRRLLDRAVVCLVTGWAGTVLGCARDNARIMARVGLYRPGTTTIYREEWVESARLAPQNPRAPPPPGAA